MGNRTVKHFSVGQALLYMVLGLFAVTCLLPMILVVIASFSTDASIYEKGFSFFPRGWTLDGYKYIVKFGARLSEPMG